MNATPQFQQRLAVILPIVALLISVFVVYPSWGRYGDLRSAVDKKEADLQALRNAPLPPAGGADPSAPDSAQEPAECAGDLTLITQASHCRLIGLESNRSDPTAAAVPASVEPAQSDPIRAVRSKITIDGTYVQLREFLYQLRKAPRLYVVTDLDIKSVKPTPGQVLTSIGPLEATIEIERYVARPTPVSG